MVTKIAVPTQITPELAYFVGVLAGDGSISYRPLKHEYRIKCVGNPADERQYYDTFLCPLITSVFGISVRARLQDGGTTYGFSIYSKELVYYLSNTFQLPIGKKCDRLCIPPIVKGGPLLCYFLRGLADTDFCVTYKGGRKIPCICGVAKSKKFMQEIAFELDKMHITHYTYLDYQTPDPRVTLGYTVTSRVEITSKSSISIWLQRIGFSHPKHLAKLLLYEKEVTGIFDSPRKMSSC